MREATVSVAIMAHPKRAQWAEQLAEQLDAPIVWDRVSSAWDTGRRALEVADPAASHHLVVQDDAIVCRDLIAGLKQAVIHAGERPLGLFLCRSPYHRRVMLATRSARKHGRSWIEMPGAAIAGVASAHPVSMLDDLLAFDYGRSQSYDSRTSEFYRQAGIAAWWTWPSLVEHRWATSRKASLLEHPPKRIAVEFLGAEASALDVDWSTPPIIAPP